MFKGINNTFLTNPKALLWGLFFISYYCFSQKTIQKSWETTNLTLIEINSKHISKLEIISTNDKLIKLDAKIEGEYFQNLYLSAPISDKKLIITTNYPEYFVAFNDKLSAHKLHAIEVKLYVPITLALSVNLENCTLNTQGAFKDFTLNINDGFVQLQQFNGKAHIQSKNAIIIAQTLKEVGVIAKSQYGKISTPNLKTTAPDLIIEAIHANVLVQYVNK